MKEPIDYERPRVFTDPSGRGYISCNSGQLEIVKVLLEKKGISFSLDLKSDPQMILLAEDVELSVVQELLDSLDNMGPSRQSPP